MKTTDLALVTIIIICVVAFFTFVAAPADSPIREWFSSPQKAMITTPTKQLPIPQQQPQRTPIPAAVYPTNFDIGELMFFQIGVKGNVVYFLGTTNLNAILNPPTNQPPSEAIAEP